MGEMPVLDQILFDRFGRKNYSFEKDLGLTNYETPMSMVPETLFSDSFSQNFQADASGNGKPEGVLEKGKAMGIEEVAKAMEIEEEAKAMEIEEEEKAIKLQEEEKVIEIPDPDPVPSVSDQEGESLDDYTKRLSDFIQIVLPTFFSSN